jgi:hypothetical protein
VGLTTGKTLLVRMQEHSLTDYPNSDGVDTPTQGRATIYNNSNSNSTNNIRQQQQQQPQQSQSQQQKQYPSLGVKMSRSSNVVSFSKTHPHLLAAGLDKVRNDPCLLIWDVSRSLDSYCNTPTGSQTPTAFPSIRGHTQQESRSSIGNQWRLDGRTTDSYDGRVAYARFILYEIILMRWYRSNKIQRYATYLYNWIRVNVVFHWIKIIQLLIKLKS